MHYAHLPFTINYPCGYQISYQGLSLEWGGGAVDPKKPSAPHNGLYYCFDSCASNGVSNTEHE